jgi:hypothetical protein
MSPAFLQQAHRNNWQRYLESLHAGRAHRVGPVHPDRGGRAAGGHVPQAARVESGGGATAARHGVHRVA